MTTEQRCTIADEPDYTGVEIINLHPDKPLSDYLAAMAMAAEVADSRLDDPMLLSWYDCDRDFESPQHASECHSAGGVPGYVDYGLNHGATLKVDIEEGRFVFFYMDVAL